MRKKSKSDFNSERKMTVKGVRRDVLTCVLV